MARRGYLQRIAEPLTPGEPVLFAVPGPAAEDARPAVTARRPAGAASAGAAPAAAAPANPAPILRRKQAARGEKAAADQKPMPVADPGAKQIPALNAAMPQDWAAPAPAFAPPAATTEPGEKTPPASTPQPAFPFSPIPPGEADSELASVPTQYVAAWPAEHLPAPKTPRYPQSHPEEETDAPRWPAPRAAAKNTEPPRIHIGTIEIRTTTPPAPAAPPPAQHPSAAAPRAPAPSPPRGYAWRFGLVQG